MSAARGAPNEAVRRGSVRGREVVTRLFSRGQLMQRPTSLGCHHTGAAGDLDVWSGQ
ncbi:hypothetical protein ACFO1B_43705 [Dactylosporangium siamense]|uniref:hypothetical protein n=1 Tax=Dactylosporangium siamense TaxID=685454 RepID=UPI001941BB79|nr:hypothetical protein [Dactylosporangium siamense]